MDVLNMADTIHAKNRYHTDPVEKLETGLDKIHDRFDAERTLTKCKALLITVMILCGLLAFIFILLK